jgi:hypothetical protein
MGINYVDSLNFCYWESICLRTSCYYLVSSESKIAVHLAKGISAAIQFERDQGREIQVFVEVKARYRYGRRGCDVADGTGE